MTVRAGRGARTRVSVPKTQLMLWAREWALGPSDARGASPYVSHVASGTGQEEAGTAGGTQETCESAATGRPNPEGNTMSNITLKTAVRVNGWANTAVSAIQKRYEAKDRGQTAFEYLGIILVVVAIIGAIMATGIGGAISNRISSMVTAITAG